MSSLISVGAQQVLEQPKSEIGISYLESKGELDDYILDTGDSIQIRFKNRPRKLQKQGVGEEKKSSLHYKNLRESLRKAKRLIEEVEIEKDDPNVSEKGFSIVKNHLFNY